MVAVLNFVFTKDGARLSIEKWRFEMMLKQFLPWWQLQFQVRSLVRELAPDCWITPTVMPDDELAVWHKDCDVGQAPWCCSYILPPDDPSARELLPIFNAAIASLQAR